MESLGASWMKSVPLQFKKMNPASMRDMVEPNMPAIKRIAIFHLRVKIPIAYFSQLLTDYFDGQEATAYEKKLLDGISKVPVTPIMEQILAETSQFTQYRGGLGYLYLDGKLLELMFPCPERNGLPLLKLNGL